MSVNLPFERVPQCACDPGTGPIPRNAEIFSLRARIATLEAALKPFAELSIEHDSAVTPAMVLTARHVVQQGTDASK